MRICAEGVMFITADKGLGDIRVYSPGSHPGIVLLRPDVESVLEYQRLLESLLERYDLEELRGSLTVVTPGGIRIRRGKTGRA